jgi:hypothetical protein
VRYSIEKGKGIGHGGVRSFPLWKNNRNQSHLFKKTYRSTRKTDLHTTLLEITESTLKTDNKEPRLHENTKYVIPPLLVLLLRDRARRI